MNGRKGRNLPVGEMVAIASVCARRIAGRTWSEAAISPMSIPVLCYMTMGIVLLRTTLSNDHQPNTASSISNTTWGLARYLRADAARQLNITIHAPT